MINKTEIAFNCSGLVAAWFDNHKDEINEGAELSLTYDGNKTVYKTSLEISDAIFKHISLCHKGTIDFSINGIVKEHFDIL